MSLRSLSLVALLSLATPALAGERLLVAASDGAVYRMDPNSSTSAFEYFACACIGPANAMAADRQNLYLADGFGQLLVADIHSGLPKSLVTLSVGEISALAATPSGLFVGSTSGVVARVDPGTGVTLDQRMAPAAVRALASVHGNLFVAAGDSAIYRAPLDSGEFSYFSCFCFFDLQELVVDGPDLLAADGSGVVIRVDGHEGWLLSGQWTAPMNALAVSSGDYLVHAGGGVIARFDAETGLALGKLSSPLDVRAMLVVKDPRTPSVSSKPTRSQQHP
jgi:outer membrane protein assembly factor BamB